MTALNWRRTLDGWGYSPLKQIDRQNVGQLQLACEKGTFHAVDRVAGGGGTGAVKRINTFHPKSPNQLGEFAALTRDGRILWKQRVRTPFNTAALTTAGGLAFVGDWDRHFYAYDTQTGALLWQTRAPTSAQGFPITYSVRGRQYVAVPAGFGGGNWTSQVPIELTPEIKRPASGNSIVVFALPAAPRKTS